MQISVIIPTYNRAHRLATALDSVLGQSYPASQIIVIDDASNDDTVKLLGHYPGVEVVRLDCNQGVSVARNSGLAVASGEWIALLDSDDAWLPGKLAQQVAAAQREPDIRIFHTQEHWVRNGRRVNAMHKHAKPDGWIYPDSLALCCVSPSSILIHREVFEQCGDFDTQLPACEDYDLWLRMFSRYPVRLIDQPLLTKYGGHSDQLSRQYWGMDRFRIVALQKMLDTDYLDRQNRALTLNMFRQKCTVMIQGAKKRGKTERVAHYQSLINQYGEQGND